MKDRTTVILVIALIAGIAMLAFLNRPERDSVAELRSWVSDRLTSISENLAGDIERDKQRRASHADEQAAEPKGSITFTLLDKNLSRFELSQFSELTVEDVASTPGYTRLAAVVESMGLSMKLDEIRVKGDQVDTGLELDQYAYEFPRYYTITVYGW